MNSVRETSALVCRDGPNSILAWENASVHADAE